MELQDIISQIEIWQEWHDSYSYYVPRFIESAQSCENWQDWDKNLFHEFFERGGDQCVSSLKQGYFTKEEQNSIKEDWKELQQICLFLTENGVVTSENAGGHIHVGSHILENSLNYWRQFLKTYMLYEKELLEFFKGESSKMRLSSGRYAFPIAKILYQDLAALNDTLCFSDLYDEIFLKDRNVAVNFKNIKRSVYKPYPGSTIEFRSPNGTSKEIIWQNNINTAVKLFKAPVKGMIDEEYLDYRLREELPTESSYTNALELVDTIFDNNLDKIYFLKQYNKDFNFKEEKSRGLIKSKF